MALSYSCKSCYSKHYLSNNATDRFALPKQVWDKSKSRYDLSRTILKLRSNTIDKLRVALGGAVLQIVAVGFFRSIVFLTAPLWFCFDAQKKASDSKNIKVIRK